LTTAVSDKTNILGRGRSRRDVKRASREAGAEDDKRDTEDAGEGTHAGGDQKPLLILDYPSVMYQLSPLHLRELPKLFEVVLVGRTDEFTQGDLEVLRINVVAFHYVYPDAEVRERFRRVIRDIIQEFKAAPVHYFSSMHWWAMEEAAKCAAILIPTPAVRSIATAIARQTPELVSQIIKQYTIRIVR